MVTYSNGDRSSGTTHCQMAIPFEHGVRLAENSCATRDKNTSLAY